MCIRDRNVVRSGKGGGQRFSLSPPEKEVSLSLSLIHICSLPRLARKQTRYLFPVGSLRLSGYPLPPSERSCLLYTSLADLHLCINQITIGIHHFSRHFPHRHFPVLVLRKPKHYISIFLLELLNLCLLYTSLSTSISRISVK